ncbi:hypothetical protein EVAR_102122_1 [Eumeta japonica]|uniref:Uncharacterized protein n=1 Tax=Eumeta variegata TaxID=151549 RepID=A0A4C1U0J6_EUMVA|nr:hypothetical protein EVAR_102122_1 [Eumeta japonica]
MPKIQKACKVRSDEWAISYATMTNGGSLKSLTERTCNLDTGRRTRRSKSWARAANLPCYFLRGRRRPSAYAGPGDLSNQNSIRRGDNYSVVTSKPADWGRGRDVYVDARR